MNEKYKIRNTDLERENENLLFKSEELYKQKIEAEKIARVDSLTELPNRKAYEERFEEAINNAKRTGQPFCLMALDIDDFKQINDNEGHEKGNKALKTFAKIVKENLRSTDIVARTGGEEFFVIFQNTTIAEATKIGEKVGKAIRIQSEGNNHSKFTVSGGIVQFEETEKTRNNRLGMEVQADAALYQAKSSGKDRILAVDVNRIIEKGGIINQAKKLIQRIMPKELNRRERADLLRKMAEELEAEEKKEAIQKTGTSG